MVPDLGMNGAHYWQRRWVRHRHDCLSVDLDPDAPAIRNVWLSRIDQTIGSLGRPVVLVGHGLGALAIAWWAALLGRRAARSVTGALLVTPADPDGAGADEAVRGFGPLPTAMLPFPSIVVATDDHPRTRTHRFREMAGEWVSDFVSVGALGDLRPARRVGLWPAGQGLLELVIGGGPGLSRYSYRPEPPVRNRRGSVVDIGQGAHGMRRPSGA
jgi:predicted alpha/beta hydrolase family esterase